jgi:hypothetical protein
MVKPRLDEILRHETFLDDDDDSFVPDRRSGVVVNPGSQHEAVIPAKRSAPQKRGSGKRGLEDMMANMSSDAAQAIYAMERLASCEDQMAKIFKLCTPGALAIVLKERPSLKRYSPEADEE